MTFTAQMAAQATQWSWEEFPPPVREVARHAMLDWFGVALAGHRTPLVDVLFSLARIDGATPAANVIGHKQKVSLPQAALINGAASHALDFDDVHPLSGHPSAAIIPAVLALAQSRRASGAQLLTAYVAGFEAMCTLGAAIGPQHYERGYHTTATLGVVGAAVACGQLMGMSADTLATAIGIAASQSSGLKINFGTMTKPYHAGHAAHDGLQSARLAAAGFTAHPAALDGPIGFLAVLGTGADGIEPHKPSRRDYHLLSNLFKYHAACYLTHAAIDSAVRLAQRPGFSPQAIAAVRITVNPSIQNVCNIPEPNSGLAMKFSIAHVVAMALEGRPTADPKQFSDSEAVRITQLPMRQRTSVMFDTDLPLTGARVELTLADGTRWEESDDSNTPAKDLAAQREKLMAKFRGLNADLLGRATCQTLMESLLQIDQCTDITTLGHLAGNF
jgi:2-methylcitrate dehydratase PrpD